MIFILSYWIRDYLLPNPLRDVVSFCLSQSAASPITQSDKNIGLKLVVDRNYFDLAILTLMKRESLLHANDPLFFAHYSFVRLNSLPPW